MGRPRLLTDPDEISASDEFKRLLTESGKSQEAVAAEIGDGVTQGTVWQWANRRLAIPAARAQDAARAVNGRPSAISVAWRSLQVNDGVAEDAAEYRFSLRSQPVGIQLGTITDAMVVVKAYLEDKGLPADLATDPVLIKAAIDVVVEKAEPLSVVNVIAFKRKLTERLEDLGYDDDEAKAAGAGPRR